jgi:hypothetical protein
MSGQVSVALEFVVDGGARLSGQGTGPDTISPVTPRQMLQAVVPTVTTVVRPAVH